MKTIWKHCLLAGWASILLLLISCGNQNQWEQESADLIKSSQDLADRHHRLDTRVDSLWDTTTALLEKQLPLDFPSIDRDIFLNARNADHMTMFKSYELLDTQTKSLIVQAGLYDQMIAKEMQDLMAERSILEKSKNHFLSEVAQSDLKLSRQYAEQFRSASETTLQ
jgi:hypothetical protein